MEKGLRLWSLEPKGAKLIISRDVIFNESIFPSLEKTNHAGTKEEDANEVMLPLGLSQEEHKAYSGHVEQEAQGNSDQVEQFGDDHAQKPQDNQEKEVASNHNDYQFTRDRERRRIRPPPRYGFAEVVAIALYSEGEQFHHEP